MSTRNISEYVKEMYAMDISATEISHITDKIVPLMNEWRNRPLEAVYPFVFLDYMHYKVRDNGTVESRAGYSGPTRATFSAELEPLIPENLSHFFNLVRVLSG
jgi:hypothetical protein